MSLSCTRNITYRNQARVDDIINNLIPAAQTKVSTNKSNLMGYITRKNLDIKESDIDEIYTHGLVMVGGKLDINATLNKSKSAIDRELKGKDKSIKDYSKALEKHERRHVPPMPAQAPEPEPKWWQFRKRFQNWNEKRKQARLPLPASAPTVEAKNNPFKDSMKYDIVKDLVTNMEKDERKDAKAERKAEEASR